MLVIKQLTVAIDLHGMKKKLEFNGYRQLFSFFKIYFVLSRRKQTYTGLEQLEGEQMMTELSFLSFLELTL